MASMDHSFRRGEDQLPYKRSVTVSIIEGLAVVSDRLRIRPIALSDAPDVFQAFTPTVARLMTPEPAKQLSDTEAFLSAAIKARGEGSDLQLVITERNGGEFLGLIGLHTRYGGTSPELGVWLKESAWGRGYGREAVHRIIEWANDHLEFSHIVYPVAEDNLPSRRIAESYGVSVVSTRITTRSWAPDLTLVEYHIRKGLRHSQRPTSMETE